MDQNEDPVSGLERISSMNSIQAQARRRERERRVRLQENDNRRHPTTADQALSGTYESLDYEILESELYRAEENTKIFQVIFKNTMLKIKKQFL